MKNQKKYLIGIDEVGRGPLAGPVSVGAVLIEKKLLKKNSVLKLATDSKQISEKERERIFNIIEQARDDGDLDFSVKHVSAKIIDEKGIVCAIKKALENCLETLRKKHKFNCKDVSIKLDGSLSAPTKYLEQETIIKGDATVPIIGLASICAKVIRDRHMVKISKKYPRYGFEIHKGYGTKKHLLAIKKYSPTKEHRKTWLK